MNNFNELWDTAFDRNPGNNTNNMIEPDMRQKLNVEKILTRTLSELMTNNPKSAPLVEPYYRLVTQFFEITEAVEPYNLDPFVFIATMKLAYKQSDKLDLVSNQGNVLQLTSDERNAFNYQRKKLLENLLSKTEDVNQRDLISILIGTDDKESNIMTKLIKFACDHPKDKQNMSEFMGIMYSLINAGTDLPNLTRLFNLC